jgi:hypothetical protein
VYPAFVVGGKTNSLGREGDGGSIFWNTTGIGLPSCNDLSTPISMHLALMVTAEYYCKYTNLICLVYQNIDPLSLFLLFVVGGGVGRGRTLVKQQGG